MRIIQINMYEITDHCRRPWIITGNSKYKTGMASSQGRIGNEKVICHVMGLGAPYRKFLNQLQ